MLPRLLFTLLHTSAVLGCLFTVSRTCSKPGLPFAISRRDEYGIRKPCCQAESEPLCDYFAAISFSPDSFLEILGEGSVGTVQKVRHPDNGRIFARKTFQPSLIRYEALEDFPHTVQREFDIASALNGLQGFAQSYALLTEIEEDDCSGQELCQPKEQQQTIHMFMEYIPIEMKVHTHADQHHPQRTDADIRCIFSQVLSILRTFHTYELAHRDIKPDNMLFSHDGRIHLIDFGEVVGTERLATTMAGTPPYMAPETYRSLEKGYDAAAADLWGLGVFLLRLYRDDNPWDNSHTSDKKFLSFIINKWTYLQELEAPADIRSALTTLLSLYPSDRYRIYEEWSDANVTNSHCQRGNDGSLRLVMNLD